MAGSVIYAFDGILDEWKSGHGMIITYLGAASSGFSSILGKPAPEKTLTFLIDTSIFLSTVSKTSDDATIAFGGGGEASLYQKALIIEVLKDRCGTREGRWVAFEIASEVEIVPSG